MSLGGAGGLDGPEGLDAEADTTLEPWLIEARKREALDATLEDMRDTLARQADVNGER